MPFWRTAGRRRGLLQIKWRRCDTRRECRPKRPHSKESQGVSVTAVVQFAGLKEWQQIRGRLAQVPGLQGLEVNSLSARTASITFDYAGSLGRLQKVLADSGFSFENGEENFVLRAR